MDTEYIAAMLERRRVELLDEISQMTKPPEAGTNVSFGKRVGDGTTEAVERISTTATARVLARSVADIEDALNRIEKGSYGTCVGCGQEIPSDRLAAVPSTIACVECSGRNAR